MSETWGTRSIVLAKGRQFWVYEYLFAKKDRANIGDDELDGFRELAKVYTIMLSAQQLDRLLREKDWFEICSQEECHDDET